MHGISMKYFVLKPDGKSEYAKASRAAMLVFARHIVDEDVDLSDALIDWVTNEVEDLSEGDK